MRLPYESGLRHRAIPRSLACLFLAAIVRASTAQTAGTTAVKASDFLNSIGVCTHITQGKDDPTHVAECLGYAGIRAIRDDGTRNPKMLDSFVNVHKGSGAKVVLLPINGNVAASLQEYETLAAAGALLAAEGPNEPNNWHVTYDGATSSKETSMPVAFFQRDLYAAVKADPKLAGIPVFHSSEAGGSQPDNCRLQFLSVPAGAGALMPDGTRYADYANTHNYVCGHGLKGLTQDNIAWNAEDPTLNGEWDGLYVEYGHTWWGKGFDGYTKAQLEALPRVTTETGWNTRVGGGGHPSAISEDEQGKLFLNLYLDAIKRGWSYTFIYMLHDRPDDGYWGLVRIDYMPKPSATFLHNLTAIFADKSSFFTPGQVNYTIPNQPATVHDLLLQKSNGTFELVLWGEQVKGTNSVVVNLGSVCANVNLYDPTVGTTATQTMSSLASVPVTLSDHPLIIEFQPGQRSQR
ncbi:MAG: glycosyl hydrolase [Limisphaerales bacterium]